MDKYTKAVLTVIALCVLALPVKAKEKVWYCETSQHVSIFATSVSNDKLIRFKLKVTPTEAQFGQNNFITEQPMPMRSYVDQNNWIAGAGIGTAFFRNPNVSVVLQHPAGIVAVIAECEEF